MVLRNRKFKGRECTVILRAVKRSPTSGENRLTAILNLKKPRCVNASLFRQNAFDLLFVPEPLPIS